MIHVCQPKANIGRTIRKCTTCKQRKRFLVKLYEWYPSIWICGGCGWSWVDGERSNLNQKKREENRKLVQTQWSDSKNVREAIEEMIE